MWKAPVLSPSSTFSHKSMALLIMGFPNLSIDKAVDAVELSVFSTVSGYNKRRVDRWVLGEEEWVVFLSLLIV